MAAAYSAAGDTWQKGPGRIYDRLAAALVAGSPTPLDGRAVLDLGSGTGAASRAARAAGARSVTALDAAIGMLRSEAAQRPQAVVADVQQLPFASVSFDTVLAAFCLNHLASPTRAFEEIGRVLRPSGSLLASAYADDDDHPVKGAVDAAAFDLGWRRATWATAMRDEAAPLLSTPDRAVAEARRARLRNANASVVRVAFPELSADALIEWRLGMAHLQAFVAQQSVAARAALCDAARARLGEDPPTLVRSFVALSWTKPAP